MSYCLTLTTCLRTDISQKTLYEPKTARRPPLASSQLQDHILLLDRCTLTVTASIHSLLAASFACRRITSSCPCCLAVSPGSPSSPHCPLSLAHCTPTAAALIHTLLAAAFISSRNMSSTPRRLPAPSSPLHRSSSLDRCTPTAAALICTCLRSLVKTVLGSDRTCCHAAVCSKHTTTTTCPTVLYSVSLTMASNDTTLTHLSCPCHSRLCRLLRCSGWRVCLGSQMDCTSCPMRITSPKALTTSTLEILGNLAHGRTFTPV